MDVTGGNPAASSAAMATTSTTATPIRRPFSWHAPTAGNVW